MSFDQYLKTNNPDVEFRILEAMTREFCELRDYNAYLVGVVGNGELTIRNRILEEFRVKVIRSSSELCKHIMDFLYHFEPSQGTLDYLRRVKGMVAESAEGLEDIDSVVLEGYSQAQFKSMNDLQFDNVVEAIEILEVTYKHRD